MTAIAKQTTPAGHKAIRAELEAFAPSFGTLLPRGYDPARLITGAMVAVTKNPDLEKCTTRSVALALARIAQWGLEVNETAHLVPYGRECTPVADYKGLIQLMMDAGARKVVAREVRDGDHFEFEYGLEERLVHRPLASRQGKILGAYAIVTLRGGVQQFEYMTAAEIDAIRQAKSKAWKQGPLTGWYAKKTVIRQVSKYVPRTARLTAVLEHDEETYDFETGEVLPRAAIPSGIRHAQVRTDPDLYTGGSPARQEAEAEPEREAGEREDVAQGDAFEE
jgi:recombination protein RecT